MQSKIDSGDLGNGTFLNPILRGNYADPSIIRVGHDYYMVHTSYKYVPGLIIWHSKDLVNWNPITPSISQREYWEIMGFHQAIFFNQKN